MDRGGGWFDSMPCFLYVLRSLKSGRYYVGSSEDPSFKLNKHNQGKADSTKAYCPWEIVCLEEYATRPRHVHVSAASKRRKAEGGSKPNS